jgi:hypothetical protein
MSALDTQVGGGHYKDMAIQPLEYILANKLNFIEGNIIKYITRYHLKGGVEDVEKVIHYATILKEQLVETKKVQQNLMPRQEMVLQKIPLSYVDDAITYWNDYNLPNGRWLSP